MTRRFADTGYFIALLNPADQLHVKAISIARTLDRQPIITSNLVLIELLNDFADRGELLRGGVITFIDKLYNAKHVQVVEVDEAVFHQAFQLYRDRLDKAWSLTDCASFIIMSGTKVSEALAYDKHFIQAGFRALLRE